ncbi:MAG: tetratricopeptide repeat protein, partial [Elusimicrobiota bacterium]
MNSTLLLVTLLFSCAPANSAEPSDFARANLLYEESRLDDAVREYRALTAAEPQIAELHYNLGNAYFRLGTPGSLGRAIA